MDYEALTQGFNLVVEALNGFYKRRGYDQYPSCNLTIFEDGSWTIEDWDVPSHNLVTGTSVQSFVTIIGGQGE